MLVVDAGFVPSRPSAWSIARAAARSRPHPSETIRRARRPPTHDLHAAFCPRRPRARASARPSLAGPRVVSRAFVADALEKTTGGLSPLNARRPSQDHDAPTAALAGADPDATAASIAESARVCAAYVVETGDKTARDAWR